MSGAIAMEVNSVLSGLMGSGATKKDEAQDINDRFLKLLVAQMKNQDPLNPLDNAQVTSQMAQINTVTGINNLNATLGKLLEQFAGLQALQAAELTGRDVLVSGNQLRLHAEGDAMGAVELSAETGSVKVDIRDGNGLLVRTLDLGACDVGTTRFSWDGRTDAGAAAAPGSYTFAARGGDGGKEFSVGTLMTARVEGVRSENGTVQLVLAGLGSIAYADIKQIL
jgi:flagellar basal-body rod modification protein FlgD